MDSAVLHHTWHILYQKNRDFLCRLPLALRTTIARAANAILRIIIMAFTPMIPEVEAAFIRQLELEIPSGTLSRWSAPHNLALFIHKLGGLEEIVHVSDFEPAKRRNVPS
jgi:hypothetical protein